MMADIMLRLLSGLVTGGISAIGKLGALSGARPSTEEEFFHWTGPSGNHRVGAEQVKLPILYQRDDCFLGVFDAARGPIEAVLPTRDLHPVSIGKKGRVAVIFMATNYLESSIGPYGELAIAIPCTHRRAAPPLVPLLLEDRLEGWAPFVLHLPVTLGRSRDAGREIWGYPKFLADMDFRKRPAYQSVRLSEGGRHLLTLTVLQRGIPLRDDRPLITYTTMGSQLIRTALPSRAVCQLSLLPGLAKLELGAHPLADQLRSFDVSCASMFSRNYLTRGTILPAGEVVGTVERPYAGFVGADGAYGRLTTSYDDLTGMIDVYRRMRPAS